MDKRKLLLPDILGKPLGLTNHEGQIIFPQNIKFPADQFIFFIPQKEWMEIKELRKGENYDGE